MSNPNRNQSSSPQQKVVADGDIIEIITQEDVKSVRKLVDVAEKFGKHIAKVNKVTTSQIRNVYGTVKKLEMTGWNDETARRLLLLKPLMAYAAGRHGGGVKELEQVISQAIDQVSNANTFKRFCQFFEAIIAYHKANGGKD